MEPTGRFVVLLGKGRLGWAAPAFCCGELAVLSFEAQGLVATSSTSSAGAGAGGSASGTASSVDAMVYVERAFYSQAVWLRCFKAQW